MVLRTDGRKAHCSAPYRHGFLYTYFKQAQKHVTCNKEAFECILNRKSRLGSHMAAAGDCPAAITVI